MSGFTKVDHLILEEVASRKFNATELSILMIVWRMTYGFNRNDHELAINYFVKTTGLSKRGIQDAVNGLVKNNVLVETQQASFNQTRKISFNKKVDDWGVESRRIVLEVKDTATGNESCTSPVAEDCTSPVAESCTHDRKVIEIFKEKDDGDLMTKPVPFLEYEKHFGTAPSAILQSDFDDWIDKSQLKDPEEIICVAIKRAKLQTPKYPGSYIKKIVDDWINLGLFTLGAVEAYNHKFDSKISGSNSKSKVLSLSNMFERPKDSRPLTEKELKEIEALEDQLPF